MVLDHVAKAPCRIVELPPAIHTEGLCHGDLDITDVVAVPDRLKKGIRKPRVENVLCRLLAQVMVDTEDLPLIQNLVECPVQRFSRGLVMAERFLNHDTRILVNASGSLESLGDRSEENRGDGQIMDWALSAPECLLECLEGRSVTVVAIDILEPLRKLFEELLIHPATVGGDPLAGAVNDLLARHAALGDTDNRPLQDPAAVKRLNGVKEFLVSQISRGPEKNENVTFVCGHGRVMRCWDCGLLVCQ